MIGVVVMVAGGDAAALWVQRRQPPVQLPATTASSARAPVDGLLRLELLNHRLNKAQSNAVRVDC